MTPILPPDEPPNRSPERPDSWYRRGWVYSNRPYGGCGCLYTLVVVFLILIVLSYFIPSLAFWNAYF
ncbi:MAG: hypothetical protein IT329_11175 [Caldilineaceae bacterium]|nr:hypothetical protein [Caldilineaceae bacterium]